MIEIAALSLLLALLADAARRPEGTWQRQGRALVGYRIMRFDPGEQRAISAADSRQSVSLQIGSEARLAGKGMFLTASPQYARDHYANHDWNVLLAYAFEPADVTSGSLTDREPEIAVRRATLLGFEIFDGDGNPAQIVRWTQFPEDFQTDGFIEQELMNLLPHAPLATLLPIPTAPVLVVARPMDEVWPIVRAVFPGPDDAAGRPVDFTAEDIWDDRGPAQVIGLMRYLERLLPNPAEATAEEILAAFLGPAPIVKWERPKSNPQHWEGDASMAPQIVSFTPAEPGEGQEVALPPVVLSDDQFVDGRHRCFAARLLGLRFIPTMDVRQFVK